MWVGELSTGGEKYPGNSLRDIQTEMSAVSFLGVDFSRRMSGDRLGWMSLWVPTPNA